MARKHVIRRIINIWILLRSIGEWRVSAPDLGYVAVGVIIIVVLCITAVCVCWEQWCCGTVCSGLVRPIHDIIRVEMQRDLVGTPRRCTVGIFDRFAVVQLYKRLSAVCIVGIFRAPSVTGERVCQLGRLHISAENALFNAYARW